MAEHIIQVPGADRLTGLSVAFLRGDDQTRSIQSILDCVKKLGFERVRLYSVSPDGGFLVGRAHIGMEESFVGCQRPCEDDPYIEILVREQSPHLFTRNPEEPAPFDDRHGFNNLREWLCVPFFSRGRLIGKLSVDNYGTDKPIDKNDVELLSLLTALLASAIGARQRAAQLETLRSTGLTSTSEPNHYVLLQTIVKNAVKLLSAKGGGLYEYDSETQELTIISDYNRPANIGIKMA